MRLISKDTLELMEISPLDAGYYQCLVDNGGDPVMYEQAVFISQPPSISWCNISITVVAGDTATFHCHVTGSPEPRVTWRKSDGTLASMEQNGSSGLFLLRDAEVRDSGTLSCIATNNLGQSSSCNTSLIVIGKLSKI